MKRPITYFFIYSFILLINSVSFAQRNSNYTAAFYGSIAYIAVPDSPELNPTTAITIEAWVNPSTYLNYPTIVGKNYISSYWLGINSLGRLRFYPKGAASLIDATVNVPLNTWSHVAATYDGTKVRLYLNGAVTDSSTSITGAITANTDSLFIGCDRNGSTKAYFFNGQMDNVRLWNVARTPQQIRSSMYIPLQVKNPTGNYSGLAASYQFDDSNGCSDWSGVSNDNGFPRNMIFNNFTNQPVNFADFNNSLSLDGNSYCAVENSADFNSSTAITLEAWIKRDLSGTQPGTNPIIGKSSSGRCDYIIFLQSAPTTLWFQMNNPSLGGTNTVSASVASGITDDAWHHIAVSYNSVNGQATLYVDGNNLLQTTISGNPAIPNNNDSLFVGTARGYSSDKFKGMIDEVRIWKNTVRTQTEIQTDMYKSRGITFGTSGSTTIAFDDYTNFLRAINNGNSGNIKFRGNAVISSPKLQNTYSSPIIFNSNYDDAAAYLKSTRHITIAPGATINDSVTVTATNVNVADLKLFVLLSHAKVGSISMDLISPTGISVSLLPAQNSALNDHDVMTFFNMTADSTLKFSNGATAPFSPLIKPANNLSAFTGSRATGVWKLRITDNSTGTMLRILNGWGMKLTTAVGIGKEDIIPNSYYLSQNYPNPFNPSTIIKFSIPSTEFVRLDVFNILGEKVQTLLENDLNAGNHEITFDASKLASGVYFYKISAGAFQQARKMILIK